MRSIAVAGALLFFGLAGSPSRAATIPFGDVSGGYSGTVSTTNPVSGLFDDLFTFSSTSVFNLNISILSAISGGAQLATISSPTFSIHTPSATINIPAATFNPAIGALGSFSGTSFSPGSYSFELSGTTSRLTDLTSSVTLSVSPVPIPATLPMFGAALLGIGAVGFARRSKGRKVGAVLPA